MTHLWLVPQQFSLGNDIEPQTIGTLNTRKVRYLENSSWEVNIFTDPVCGMEVHESTAPASTCHEGVIYYFCSRTCLGAFQDNPHKYVDEVAQHLLQHLAYPHPSL